MEGLDKAEVAEIVDTVIAERGLAVDFPEGALKEALQPPADTGKRADYRQMPFVTIDGEDAKDFDDAVCCQEHENELLHLFVAIADVAAFVVPGGELDKEAQKRGTSVYLPDRVLPMLPPALSTDLCSLKPDEDRLSLVCEMELKGGDVLRYRFTRAVIRSERRLTYTRAAAEMNAARPPKTLRLLMTVGEALRKKRKRQGSLMIERPERQISVNEGVVSEQISIRTVAHWVIEECMIAANNCAADFLIRNRRPTLHRIHKKPSADSVQKLANILSNLGIDFPKKPVAQDFGKVLIDAAKKSELLAESLFPIVLGTLSRAEYAPCETTGHFGLACQKYLHFTSPIRRYPDLVAHRAIFNVLAGAALPPKNGLAEVGTHCSEKEVNADKAGWDCRQRLLCVRGKGFVGRVFTAVVSGVLPYGFFVLSPELGVDGMVRISAMRGYWTFSDKKQQFESGGDAIRIGDFMEVRLKSVDPKKGQANFVPIYSN